MAERSINPARHIAELPLIGGALCLDFTNTIDWRGAGRHNDRLTAYPDLAWWSCRVGLLSKGDVRRLLKRAAQRPGNATRVLRRAVTLREALYRIFSAVAIHRRAPASDLDLVNRQLGQAFRQLQVRSSRAGFRLEFAGQADALDRMLGPVLRSAAELLASDDLQRLKECRAGSCAWLFLDTSKNRSRRWCKMSECGNRAKARRYYKRGQSRQRART